MAMNFFNSKIVTKQISLEDAIKGAQGKAKVRSLDEIIADAKKVKTAAVQAEVKTASVEAPKVEAPKVETKEAAAPAVQVKTAAEFGLPSAAPARPAPGTPAPLGKPQAAPMPAATSRPLGKGPSISPAGAPPVPGANPTIPAPMGTAPVAPNAGIRPPLPAKPPMPGATPAPMGAKPPMGTAPVSPVAKPPMPTPGAMASAKHTLKIASSLDFRNWEAQAVADAWKQHGSVENCMANVASQTNDPKSYCGLLRVAATEATQVIKTAAAKKEEKTATPLYQKIAKLDAEKLSGLREYFTLIYGKDYVEAMLADF